MDLELLENKLVESVKTMPERKALKEIEDKIFSTQECLILISSFHEAQNDYNFTLKIFNENHELTKQKQKKLHEEKLKMDSHPLIAEYNKLLSICNEPLRYVEYKLISLFQKGAKHQC